jgi:HTH-type transcriptional regulator / antitoxin HipB
MSDLQNYIKERKKTDKKFANNYDSGFQEFKIGIFLKQERIKNGITQKELAEKIHTTKSVISRIENHAEDIKLSTLEKVAQALGKKLLIKIM